MTAAVWAAVDMGSNSFRLEIVRADRAGLVRLDYLKESVRQGAGLEASGDLSAAAMQRGLDCLARFAERLRDFKPQQVRAVATQTLREARNAAEFLRRAQSTLGFPIEVISGREEARLIYAGVSGLLADDQERRLVIDIGGRSTEVILGEGRKVRLAESYKLGSVSHSVRYFPDGRVTQRGFDAAVVAAAAALEESQEAFGFSLWDVAYGSSGTSGAVADILRENAISDGTITEAHLAWLTEMLIKAGHADKLKLDGIKEDRRAVIAGGLAVITALFASFNLKELVPAKGALRQGVVFEMLGREAGARDLREESVAALQERFGVDAAQSARVEACAQMLYAQLGKKRSPELAWAARLHELGMVVSHSDFHKHGAYLMRNADAAGFALEQQNRVAALIEAQRGRVKKAEAFLSDSNFVSCLFCLRLAVIFCNSRRAPELDWASFKQDDRSFELSLASSWAKAHPQTQYLLEEEVLAWEKTAYRLALTQHS